MTTRYACTCRQPGIVDMGPDAPNRYPCAECHARMRPGRDRITVVVPEMVDGRQVGMKAQEVGPEG